MKHVYVPTASNELTGRTVVMADGDEVGVVEGVIAAAHAEAEAHVIVAVTATATVPSMQWSVPAHAIHTITETDVILGTRADWIEPHHWTQPPADE